MDATFDVLNAAYDVVLFCAGNHDVWVVGGGDEARCADSLEKLE